MPWATRGLRHGIVTTRWPRRRDGYSGAWRGAVTVTPAANGGAGHPGDDGARPDRDDLSAMCPTGAIAGNRRNVSLDRGRCISCARCVQAHPELFRFDPNVEVAVIGRSSLVVPAAAEGDDALDALRADLARRVRALHRSVHIRHVDAGSDGADEWEVAALTNPIYDMQRLGVFFTASPRHGDILLVTGAGARGMHAPLLRTREAMPTPTVVIAAGTDAVSGGLVSPTYATAGGIGDWVPVDVWVPGSPPSPFGILHGILLAIGQLPTRDPR